MQKEATIHKASIRRKLKMMQSHRKAVRQHSEYWKSGGRGHLNPQKTQRFVGTKTPGGTVVG